MTSRDNQQLASGINEKRNLKNIYVKKISSMMKLSNQNLLEQKLQITQNMKKKKIEKVKSLNMSQDDKNIDKLYKNRISAKRARLRKKLYIRLLQTQVAQLRQINENGKRIEKESIKFLQMINNKEQIKNRMQDEVQRYFSREDLSDLKQNQKDGSTARMDKIVEELCQISMPSSLKNIREMVISNQTKLSDILKDERDAPKVSIILKKLIQESQQLPSIFNDIKVANERVKSCILAQQSNKDDLFMQNFQVFGQVMFQEKAQDKKIYLEDFCSYYQKHNDLGVFINLIEAQRILIQASTFLDVSGVQKQQNN